MPDGGGGGTDAVVTGTDAGPSLCQNGTIDTVAGEPCDPTATPPVPSTLTCATVAGCMFQGGSLSCSASCFLDPSMCTPACGDGSIRSGCEQCDGTNLGGESCASQGFTGGTLTCTPGCMFDTTACTP